MTQKPEETIAWMNTLLAYDTGLLPTAYLMPVDAIRQLLATMKVMGDALEIVNAIARGDKESIEKHGFEFNGGEKCSAWAEAKIDAALVAYEPFKALAEKAGA